MTFPWLHDLAVNAVCPNNNEPRTAYEINMVKTLEEFGAKVMDKYATTTSYGLVAPPEVTPAVATVDTAELLRDRADAERYRWLRDGDVNPSAADTMKEAPVAIMFDTGVLGWTPGSEDIDTAVDDAMAYEADQEDKAREKMAQVSREIVAFAAQAQGTACLATEKGLTPTGQHIADCERDAARYRFIRSADSHELNGAWAEITNPDCNDEKMDAAIDAAMKESDIHLNNTADYKHPTPQREQEPK